MLLSLSIGEEDRKATLDIMHVITRWGLLFILGVAVVLSLSAEPLTRGISQEIRYKNVLGLNVLMIRI
ncbi:MAG: hypothetical protein II888_04415 [Clostridia bacterium]|nr:hypothetical protein [Clostridia bacterium]